MFRRTEVAGFLLMPVLLVSLVFSSEGRDRVFPVAAQVLATMSFVLSGAAGKGETPISIV